MSKVIATDRAPEVPAQSKSNVGLYIAVALIVAVIIVTVIIIVRQQRQLKALQNGQG